MPLTTISAASEQAAYTALVGQVALLVERTTSREAAQGVDANLRATTFRGLGQPNASHLLIHKPQLVDPTAALAQVTAFSDPGGLPTTDNLRPEVDPASSVDDIARLCMWCKDVMRHFLAIFEDRIPGGIVASGVNLNNITPAADVGDTLIAIEGEFTAMITYWNANSNALQRDATGANVDPNFPVLPPMLDFA